MTGHADPAMGSTGRLGVSELTIGFGSRRVVAIDELRLGHAEILGLAGESGSGKSLTTLAILWRKVFPGDVRDMVLARSRDGGRTDGRLLVGSDSVRTAGIGAGLQRPQS